jgi:imidazolonepropionase-like amidohydrolase
MTEQWIRCGSAVIGDGQPVKKDVGLLLRDGRIVSLEPWSSVDVGDKPVIDHRSRTVCPGFIDLHVHLLFTSDVDHALTRGAVEDGTLSQLALTGARNAVECLLGGITTVRDCGDIAFVTLDIRDAIEARQLPGPRILAAGPPVTTTGGHLHWCGNAADSLDELRKATRASCARGVDLIKVMASGGNMTHGSNPRLPQFSEPELETVVGEAHRLQRRVAAHALNTAAIQRATAAGVDTLEHCIPRGADGHFDLPDSLVADIVDRQTWIVLTMAGLARRLLPEFEDESRNTQDPIKQIEYSVARDMSDTGNLVGDHEWARRLRDAGAKIALASDAGVRFTPFRRFDLSLRAGVVALEVSAATAISLATGAAAQAAGLDDQVGYLKAGYNADLVVLDELLDDASTAVGTVVEVWRDGSAVVRDGAVLGWEYGVNGLD